MKRPVQEQPHKHPTVLRDHELLEFVDRTVSTTNPAVLAVSSNVADAPLPKNNPHICSKPYSEIEDYHQDLSDLIATCQRHTSCSAAYCLRTSHGVQKCHFGYPKPLQTQHLPCLVIMRMTVKTKSQCCLLLETMDSLTASIQSSCLLGVLMWTCNIVCQSARLSSMSPSMPPRVSLDHYH